MANIGGGAVNGADLQGVVQVTGSYAVQSSDQFVQVTTGSSVAVVTLPAPQAAGSFNAATMRPDQSTSGQPGNVGQTVTIQKVDSGAGTVTISGALNIGKVYGLASKWSQAKFMSDGVNWNLLGTVS